MIEIGSWESSFQMWHFSVSYRRLLWRSLEEGIGASQGRIDVLFSNVETMQVETEYSSLRIEQLDDAEVEGMAAGQGAGRWYRINGGDGYIRATHCEWHEDDGNAMSPSRFGPFMRTN